MRVPLRYLKRFRSWPPCLLLLPWAELTFAPCGSSLQICPRDVMTNRVVDEVELAPVTALPRPLPPQLVDSIASAQTVVLAFPNHLSQPSRAHPAALVHLFLEAPIRALWGLTSPVPKFPPHPAVVCAEQHNKRGGCTCGWNGFH